MLSERLQILISSEQRRRLDREARRRDTSVGSLVREALDARFGGVGREQKVRAVKRMRNRRVAGPAPAPEELDRLVEEEREANAPGALPQRRRG